MKCNLFLGVLLVCFAALPARAAQKPLSASEPIEIAADRLEADDASRQITFSGDVVAKQGDLTIYAMEMDLFLDAESQEIRRVEALGDVRIIQGEKVATGQKGVFFRDEGKIVLTGKPKVNQGQDFISGEEITVFLDQERSVVTGGGEGRVRATFHPKENAE